MLPFSSFLITKINFKICQMYVLSVHWDKECSMRKDFPSLCSGHLNTDFWNEFRKKNERNHNSNGSSDYDFWRIPLLLYQFSDYFKAFKLTHTLIKYVYKHNSKLAYSNWYLSTFLILPNIFQQQWQLWSQQNLFPSLPFIFYPLIGWFYSPLCGKWGCEENEGVRKMVST